MEFLTHFLSYSPESNFLFTSLEFWLFLALTLGGFSLCYKNRQIRNTFLFACSLFFYYKTGGYFIFILLLSILLNYGIGLQMENSGERGRKIWVGIGILANLFILGIFKYSAFFTELWNAFFHTGLPAIDYLADGFLSMTYSQDLDPTAHPFLPFAIERMMPPIGISFFTFQAISYLADIKRGKIKAEKNLGDFGFYLSFFPQLVAGPIVRANEFLPQLQRHYMLSSQEFSTALGLILGGLIKKILVADYLSVHFAAPVFDNPDLFTGFENWMAMYAFSLQIYCDFSGYTDIAIGVAALFGFHLPANFRSPYKASSLTDFWHRWHITLSAWFRDYLYIPLGGNRHGTFRMITALLVTMLAAGLWHGAGLGFLIWGGLHGIGLCIEKLGKWNIRAERSRANRIIGWFITFHFVGFAWIFFRADSLQSAADMFFRMFGNIGWAKIPEIVVHYRIPFAIMAASFLFFLLVKERRKKALDRFFSRMPLPVKFLVVLATGAVLVLAGNADMPPFIYFQF